VGGWGEPQGKGFHVLEDGTKQEGAVRSICGFFLRVWRVWVLRVCRFACLCIIVAGYVLVDMCCLLLVRVMIIVRHLEVRPETF